MSVADRYVPGKGEYIGPHFRVQKMLGEGSYGIVFLAENLSNDPNIRRHGSLSAVKILKLFTIMPELRKEIVERFKREYDCGRIESEHLVHAYDFGEVKGNPYFAMQYCSSGSSANWAGKQVDFTRLDRFAREVFMGLHVLHRNGIIHRDIKPENILLDERERAKLTDFGIAGYQNARMTKVNMFGKSKDIFGTYAYIAPEQANASVSFKTLAPTADLFSLGVTFFEIATGHLPFGPLVHDADLGEYMRRAAKGEWDSLRRHRPEAPDHWVQLVEGCLHPNYKQRLQSAQEAMQLLGGSIDFTPAGSYDFLLDTIGLQVMHGDEPGRIYNLSRALPAEAGQLTLGWFDAGNPRNNDLTLVEKQTKYISRHHATLVKDPTRRLWLIKDGQWREQGGAWGWYPSTNGTLVNATEADASGTVLNPGDIITVGDTTLKVVVRRNT